MLIGREYWKPLTTLLDGLAKNGAIDAGDLRVMFVTDSVDDAIAYVKRNAVDRFALRAPVPSRWFGEAKPHHVSAR